MGCVQSAPEEKKFTEEEEAKMQRRRLSVAPQHVGDITAGELKKEEEKNDVVVVQQPDVKADPKSATSSKRYSYAVQSKKGFVPYNRNKVNQDRYICKSNVKGDAGLSLFGVMDGHGENGHHVAAFVEENLPKYLEKQANLRSDTENAILAAVKNLVAELASVNINIAFSGTTAVFSVKVDNTLYIANIGDSRCVLCQKTANGTVAIPLSRDQKPEDPDEKARIIQHGGRVEPLPGPPGEDCGPPRVWLAEVDVPGLAMSRSIGDEVSQTVGVISVPEIKRHDITNNDMFVVWASDGVWEFLSNEQACAIINNHINDLDAACTSLIQAAHERWTKEEEVVDDITCVILRFQDN